MDETKPDWNISDLYQKAWEVVKKNKVLWVFGTAIAGLSASSSFNSSSNLDSEDFQKLFNSTDSSSTAVNNVLGATASPDTFTSLSSTLASAFSTVPVWLYVLLAIEVIVFVGISIALNVVARAWMEGALLQSAELGLNNHKVTIEESSSAVFPNLKSIAWLLFVPSLALAFIGSFGLAILAILISVTSGLIQALLILLIAIGIGALIYWAIILGLSLIWAIRKVAIDNKNGRQALAEGYRLVKRKGWAMILLGLVNTILSWIIIGVILAAIGGFIFGGILSYEFNQTIGATLGIVGIVLAVSFILASSLIAGVITAFKATVWSQAYKNIKDKYRE